VLDNKKNRVKNFHVKKYGIVTKSCLKNWTKFSAQFLWTKICCFFTTIYTARLSWLRVLIFLVGTVTWVSLKVELAIKTMPKWHSVNKVTFFDK